MNVISPDSPNRAHVPTGRSLSSRSARCALVLALATSTITLAQVQPTQDNSALSPAPTTQPALSAATTQPAVAIAPDNAPTTQPATQPTTQPTGPLVATTQGGGILFNFKDASIDSVLDQLSQEAGFIIVRETPTPGRITVLSKQAVSRDDAVALLNTVLKANNLAAIQMGRTLKIVSRDRAKTSAIPVRTGSDPADIAQTDELITQVVPIRSIDATQLRNDLSALISPDATVSANANSNSIIITDTSNNIRHIVEIIEALDTHQASAADVKVYQLKFASAASTAKLINDVFGSAATQTAAPGAPTGGPGGSFRTLMMQRFGGFGGPGGFGRPGGNGAPGSTSAGSRSTAKVTASSDDRTNTLVVSGPTDTLPIIERVVKEIDSNPIAEQSVFIYNLKNGSSDNLAAVINSLINGTSGGYGTSGRTGTNRNQQTGRTGFGGGSSGRGTSGGGTAFGAAFGTNPFQQAMGVTQRPLSAAASSAASDLAGQVTVVPNEDTNSLLVMTAPKNFDRVKMILDELDRPVPQVLIKVLVAEVTHDNLSDIGTEFSALNFRANGNGTGVGTDPTNKNMAPLGPGFGTTTPPTDSSNGGLVAHVVEANMTATFRALQTAGKLDVLSRPYILTSDNQLASIMIGQSVPYPTNSRITDTGQIINSLQYRDVGIILNVTPHVNPQGIVTLDVNPEVSSLTGQTVPISQGVGAPIFNQRESLSRVAVVDGQTIVIGGMMEDRKTEQVDKVPLLGDIPGLGLLFTHNNTHKTKTELLFFLTPHVASQPNDLDSMAKDEVRGTKLTPNAVEPGAFQEHMAGMQRGAASRPSTQPTH